jgi:multidrug resistance efflux pump
MKTIPRIALILLCMATLAGCAPLPLPQWAQVSARLGLEPATTSDVIAASGTIEADKITISAEIGGRITRVAIGEGDNVTAGQTLIEIDGALLDAQIGQAQAALASAQAELARVSAGPRPAQVEAAQAALAQAETRQAGARRAWDDAQQVRDNLLALDTKIQAAENEVRLALARVERATASQSEARVRYESYQAGGTDMERSTKEILAVQVEIAGAALEQAKLGVWAAQSALDALRKLRDEPAAAEAAVHRAETGYQLAGADVAVKRAALALAQAGPRPQEVALTERKVALAQAAIDALEVRRAKLTLRAPRAGQVATQTVHAGETALAGAALMTLSDLSQVRLVIYVPEPQIGRVTVGQSADVSVNSYPERVFAGRVSHIATQAEFTPRNVQTQDERINTVFAVKIELENPDGILKPGMPADAVLR